MLIDVNTPVGKQSGLLATSVVACENLLTVRQARIDRVIGSLPPDLIQQVDEALKVSLDIA